MALWLSSLGAQVRGYALDPNTTPNLFTNANIGSLLDDVRGDIRDAVHLDRAMQEFEPEVVFHMAAQPLVRLSYQNPIGTYETNVIGTARIFDAVRRTPSVRAVVSVTTDKCYENKEWIWPYRESDPLGGHDPYSASKACAEIVAANRLALSRWYEIWIVLESDSHAMLIEAILKLLFRMFQNP